MRALQPTLLRQMIGFAAVGVVNTAVGVAVIWGAWRLLDWSALASNAAGYGVGFVLSYVLHRFVTFQSGAPIRRSLPRYALVLAAGYGANLGVLFGLLALNAPFVWAQLAALITFSVLVFTGSRLFAFDAAG